MFRLGSSARRILTLIIIYIALLVIFLSVACIYEVLSQSIEVRYVATSSMEPAFPAGSIIFFVKDPVRYGYAVGDPVIYRHPLAPSHLLFHRVIDVDGGYVYVRGDAASAAERVRAEDVTGVYLFGIPYLGLLRDPAALIIAVMIIILVFIVM